MNSTMNPAQSLSALNAQRMQANLRQNNTMMTYQGPRGGSRARRRPQRQQKYSAGASKYLYFVLVILPSAGDFNFEAVRMLGK